MGTKTVSGLVASVVIAGTVALVGMVPAAGVSATVSCRATVFGENYTYPVSVTVSGSTPARARAGAPIKMSGFRVVVTIPPSLVNLAAGYATSVSGTVTAIDVTATGSRPGSVNAAGRGIAIPTTKLVPNRALVLALPPRPKTVGSWTAPHRGVMTFQTARATLMLVAHAGNTNVNVPVTCTRRPAITISQTTVS